MQLRDKGLSLFHQGRPVLQAQLTLLYSGLLVGLLAAVLLATGTLFRHSETRARTGTAGIQPADSVTHTFDIWPALIALAALAVGVAAAWWLAGRFLRPLRAITATAQKISATNLHQRLDLNGPDDELTKLGRTLDDLFARLEASFESQRHFVANASHELRTPLAGQRTLLQVALADPDASTAALRAACEEALQLGNQQAQLIDALLTLASSERGLDHTEHVDLADLVRHALGAAHPEIEQVGLDLDATITPASFSGDPRLVERLIANLIDNAIQHNVSGGIFEISTRTESSHAVLSISNSGPIVPPKDVERLFQPFQRTGSERIRNNGGHGLGLTIVQAIAQAHGAKLSPHARPEGGFQIDVAFPAEPVSARNA